MTVSETIAKTGITPSADYKGIEEADDFIFAIQTDKATQTEKAKWIVCADHVKEHSGALNATTTDDTFIRTGPVTTKGSVQRTLSVNGNRCVGDAFQDFVLSHAIKYGSGQNVIVPYLYFSVRTGKGECGNAALIVTSDAGGTAGAAATFAVDAASMRSISSAFSAEKLNS